MHRFLTKEQRESYLREMFYSSFSNRRPSISSPANNNARKLGFYLQKLYALVENSKGLTNEAGETLKEIVRIRMRGKPSFFEAKLYADYKRFLLVRGQRDVTMRKISEQQCFQCVLKESHAPPPSLPRGDPYWGSRQQLRCGEIVGDTVGGMDAVFGVLLYPAGGKIDSSTLKSMRKKYFPLTRKLKDESEEDIIMYHTAVHDACGYLHEYHGLGPGYNYLGTMLTLIPTFVPQSGRMAALLFWKRLVNEKTVPVEY
ncbi:uncharacterized protein LOC116616011 [Nematostella vectensis]|uniref:uncharacterized protein LOC116616011 n=1 Tax=Nematostella vectensis TaxID=45351 RepID=UPI002076E91D|nr:uncharacterized protein LOC116616011 [Nematostella vectensis]